jgi:hypothetical protein
VNPRSWRSYPRPRGKREMLARILRRFLLSLQAQITSHAARLDGRAGFILSLIDGATTVESLLDLSGMPIDETLGILEDLSLHGIVEMRPGPQKS